MVYNSKDCLRWIKKEYGIDFSDRFGIVDLVFEFVKLNEDKRLKEIEAERKQDKKEREIEETRPDYTEEIDEEGRTWYVRTHHWPQRAESRKLKKGDIIKYVANNPLGGVENGIMIVKSFDYESDFAAASYAEFEEYTINIDGKEMPRKMALGGASPSIGKFTFATEDEIKEFLKNFEKYDKKMFDIYFNSDITPDYVREIIKKWK